MSDPVRDPSTMGRDAARAEIIRLRAVLHACHDRLHQGNVDDAHEQLHCLTSGADPDTGNVSLDDAARLADFIHRFNQLCDVCHTPAAVVVMVPSVTKPGYVSMQLGGHVPTIQEPRHLMGMAPTKAAGMPA